MRRRFRSLDRIDAEPRRIDARRLRKQDGRRFRPRRWKNLSELDQLVTTLAGIGPGRDCGLAFSKRPVPQNVHPGTLRTGSATLRLHLGEPARARSAWEEGGRRAQSPDYAEARIGTTYLAENDFESARKHYRLALEAKPDLFEALYCLAVLEQDAGNAAAAFELAKKAVTSAPNEVVSRGGTRDRVQRDPVCAASRRAGRG